MRSITLASTLLLLPLFLDGVVQAATNLTYGYDANGSMIRGDGKYYEYNDANQLTKVRLGDAQGPVLAEFVYDHSGQRLKKIENGTTTYYIGKHFQKQVTPEKIEDTSFYFVGPQRVARKSSSTGEMAFYHLDHLGNTNVVSGVSGDNVQRFSYYPFGRIRNGNDNQYSYTGKEKDNTTELYYYEARYYSTNLRIFAQPDSVFPNVYDSQDLNRYAYARNNPLKNIDPDGHNWLDSASYYGSKIKSLGLSQLNAILKFVGPIATKGIKILAQFRGPSTSLKPFVNASNTIMRTGKVASNVSASITAIQAAADIKTTYQNSQSRSDKAVAITSGLGAMGANLVMGTGRTIAKSIFWADRKFQCKNDDDIKFNEDIERQMNFLLKDYSANDVTTIITNTVDNVTHR